jgi:large subunit ribosomal protein L19
MRTKMLDMISREQTRKEALPALHIGDAVRVQVKIKEGDKERLQAFSGTLIARDGTGSTETITVRRVSYGEGVERVFPVHAPGVAKVEVEKHGKIRRAKLYYLRRATGKKSRVTETAT